eukprot:GFUD01004058.1.p1 GENE.GFUD01004058.1~~GFUD01004058.1.p1  ORF type:complete len:486 (-),score=123.42 GFUD01004058.1:441-1898(-)
MVGIILALGFFSFLFVFWRRKSKNLPPGPPRIPILGSVPFITMKRGLMDWVLDKSVTKHKLATVGIGPKNYFVINDFELAKELFSKEEFSGRNIGEFILSQKGYDGKSYGIIATEGSHWSRQRRFGLKTLKDFGFGKKSLEETMNIEVEEILKEFLSKKGDFKIGMDFNVPIINILWQLVAGNRFSKDDPEGMEMVASVCKMFKCHMKMVLVPFKILKMFPKATEFDENTKIYNIQRRYISREIEKHEQTLDTEHPRDFIDVYMTGMKDIAIGKDLTRRDLTTCLLDFLAAGTETSSTTLKWIVLYMTLYQDVQDKCRKEIFTLLGTSQCTVSDMMNLPYVQATISEVQRMAQVAPVSIAHRTLAPTEVKDFKFPAGSVFFANLSFIMKDPENFPQPEVFNPERFIGTDGKYEKNEKMIPFGIGKRYCMGELLARNEVFLFTVNLVQKLQFLTPNNNPAPDPANFYSSVTNIPDDFYAKIVATSL